MERLTSSAVGEGLEEAGFGPELRRLELEKGINYMQ